MLLDNLRNKLRARRRTLDLNQRQAADRMGTNIGAFNQLELGNRGNPTVDTLNTWARSLGGRLIIDVEFDADLPVRPKGQAACRLESPSAAKQCGCENWRVCYLNEAEAS